MCDTYEKCTLSKETRCALPWRYLMMRAPAQHNLLAARERGDGTPHTGHSRSRIANGRGALRAGRHEEEGGGLLAPTVRRPAGPGAPPRPRCPRRARLACVLLSISALPPAWSQ